LPGKLQILICICFAEILLLALVWYLWEYAFDLSALYTPEFTGVPSPDYDQHSSIMLSPLCGGLAVLYYFVLKPHRYLSRIITFVLAVHLVAILLLSIHLTTIFNPYAPDYFVDDLLDIIGFKLGGTLLVLLVALFAPAKESRRYVSTIALIAFLVAVLIYPDRIPIELKVSQLVIAWAYWLWPPAIAFVTAEFARIYPHGIEWRRR
jgi:hypothetical protein